MLVVKRIDVLPNFSGAVLIQWEIEDTTEDLEEYRFSILKSLNPGKDYEVIAENIEGFEFLYDVPSKYDSSVHWYFKVESVHVPSEESQVSDIFGSLTYVERDAAAESIIYQYQYFLEHILERPAVKLLIKKRFGQRCSNCWDDDLKSVTRSNCPVCYSTGFTGGYSTKDLYISFTEPGFTNRLDIGDVRDIQQGVTEAWAPSYPLVLPRDVVVDEFNRRFRVLQVQPTTRHGRIYLRQMLQLQLIPPTDVVYRFDVTNEG